MHGPTADEDAGRGAPTPRIRARALVGAGLVGAVLAGTGTAIALTRIDLDGSRGVDDLEGTPGDDRIRGFGGDDSLYGFDGDDVLRGGPGIDDIEAGPGDDRIIGGPGVDDLYGGPGDDRVRAIDRHRDDIECGDGTDRVWANPGDDVAGDCESVVRDGADVGPDRGPAPVAPAPGRPGAAVTAAEAGRIAVAHVGGVVDEIEPERDYGAAWEVEVYAPAGEYVIYVSASGEIVRVEGPFRE